MQSDVVLQGVAPSRRHLPQRYQEYWLDRFYNPIEQELRPGMSVLDVGSGRLPAIPPDRRPSDIAYVGLDISQDELNAAPVGSYDEHWVGDIVQPQSPLTERFDLIVSWQVLEHVKPMDAALDNIRSYLKPGGRFVGHLSAKYSFFGLLNQMVPPWVAPRLLALLLRRDPETVFPAYYHLAWQSKLEALMADWSTADIEPRYNGAVYLRFSTIAQRVYLLYENWAQEKGHANLATHYLIDARR